MKFNYKAILATLSLSPFIVAMPARADYPALYWWQQPLNMGVMRCLRNAEKAMKETRLQDIRRSSNDVGGHTNNAQAFITCISTGNGDSTAVIMVAGNNNNEVIRLRDDLRDNLRN
jgi:hypothetical protein